MADKNKYISYWLLLITFFVGLMIVLGGLTRLTDSGLSITTWSLFSGILPPLSSKDWENLFNLYKQIPEYKQLNFSMSVEDFKFIFWWEYIHRLLGRIVGLAYIIPLIFLSFKKIIKKNHLLSLYSIFFLICFQGFVGWYMVKSGLSERNDVSHYRLSIHLTLAFIIYLSLIWSYLTFKNRNYPVVNKKKPNLLFLTFFFLVLLQISIGALVSGLDAGQIYQTWPLMNQNYFPDDSVLNDLFSLHSLESASIVQFIHRNIAYLLLFLFIIIFFTIFKNENLIFLRKTALLVLFTLVLQIFLGILAVLSGAQIILASMHQIGSIFLITSSLILVFKNSRIN